MSYGDARPALRIGLATVVALDLVGYFFFSADARRRAELAGDEWGWLTEWVSSTPGRSVLLVAGLVGVVAFARRPGRLGAGALALGALVLLSSGHTQLFGSPWRHMFFSGLCLLGWLVGLGLARRNDRRDDESYAVTGTRALLGAAYLSAGLSKLVYGGAGWANGVSIQASVINQTGLVADTWLNAYRVWVAFSPSLAVALAVGTIVVECAGPALLGPRRIRALAAFGLVAMHFNIFLLTGILYWESMTLLVLFGLPLWDAVERDPEIPGTAGLLHDRAFVPLAALLGILWVVSVGHQAVRHHERQPVPAGVQGEGASPPPSEDAQQLGPFVVGSELAGWSISSVRADPDALRVEAQGPPGPIVFALSCEPSLASGPFDLGRAHIVYEGDLPHPDVQGFGEALRERTEQASQGREVCESLRAWRLESPGSSMAGDGGLR